jgi:hypothetical protein
MTYRRNLRSIYKYIFEVLFRFIMCKYYFEVVFRSTLGTTPAHEVRSLFKYILEVDFRGI